MAIASRVMHWPDSALSNVKDLELPGLVNYSILHEYVN